MFSRIARTGILDPQLPFTSILCVLLFSSAGGIFFASVGHAAVGHTSGTFAVSPAGAATYTIPIWAPPGPRGMQPHIALTYNSRQGNGSVGVGWAIGGLGSIYRCDLTFAQDGASAAVALATSDGLCLDGKRLRLTSGTYGAASATYQTEVADFSNVTASSGMTGNGASYFTVQARNGVTYLYGYTDANGNGANSQVVAYGSSPATASAWMLSKVIDSAGNNYVVNYTALEGAAVPNTILWTPAAQGAATYTYSMQFNYTTNPPESSIYAYIAGTLVVNADLLSSITVSHAGDVVKNYVLGYQLSPTTGREELQTLTECADSGATNCLLPTTITYQNGTAGVAAAATSTPVTTTNTSNGTLQTQWDFNGDGYRDIVFVSGTTVYVSFGSASGYGTPVSTGISSANAVPSGDLLGTGQDGILGNSGGVWYYYTWNGSSFSGTTTGVEYTGANTALVDVNGDGLPDLVTWTTSATAVHITSQLNTSSGTTVGFSATVNDAFDFSCPTCTGIEYNAIWAPGGLGPGDKRSWHFDGSRREGLLWGQTQVINGETDILVQPLAGSGTAFVQVPWSPGLSSAVTGGAVPPPAPIVADWNGDGCDDIIWQASAASGTSVSFSPCGAASAAEPVTLGPVVAVLDWNGDGRADALVNNGGTIGVLLSTGGSVATLQSTTISYSSNCIYFKLDANADGLDDLGCWSTLASPYPVSYQLHNGAGSPPDWLSSVTDGFGNSVSPTYGSLAQGVNGYFFPRSDAPAGYQNYIGPLYVVTGATFSDPTSTSGGTYYQQHFYAGAWMNVQGRGFAGFEAHQWYDSRNTVWETLNYDLAFPYTGMMTVDAQTLNNLYSESIFYRSLSLSAVTLNNIAGSQRYFPYISGDVVSNYEVTGAKAFQLITTSSASYTYDNYGNALTVTRSVTDNDSSSPYYNDTWTTAIANTPDVNTSTWCLGLFTQSQVTYTATIGSTVTQTKQFAPDTTQCRYNQVITQPNTGYAVSEAFGYDGFGNINSDILTGTGMTARTTTTNWGTTGQFPMSVVDASGATTQYNYNFSFGLLNGVTDPNSATTTWIYEGFGRKGQENRPDGTFTQWTYEDCASSGGCLVGAHGLSVVHGVYNADGSTETDGSDWFDSLDRPLWSNKRLLVAGTYDRNEVRYDSLGRLVKRAMPCTLGAVMTSCPYWTTIQYDVLNRPTAVQRPISASNSTVETTGYTYEGRTTLTTDPLSNVTTTIDDVNGRLRQTADPNGYTVTTAYDAAGNLTGATDSAGNTLWSGRYAYGISAFLTSATDMDLGAWSYTVDALGERTAWSDAKGQSFSVTYDVLSRPLTRTEPDAFTQWTWGASAPSHNVGKLQSVCMGPAPSSGAAGACSSSYYSESEAYDSLGRPSQRAITIPSTGTFTHTWQYSAVTGLLSSLTYPTSTSGYALQLQYAYQNGYPLSVTDVSDSPNVTVWQANSTNPAGQITQETLGNGIVTQRAFDAVTGWLSSVQSGVSGGTGVQNQGFLYDYVGNVTQRQDNNLGLTENIYYDSDYRLKTTQLDGTQNLALNYDVTGNITSRSDVASGATWTYDPVRKHAVTQAGSSAYLYSYDANGNALTRQGSSIAWSSYNYPTSISAGSGSTAETVALSYGPDRKRWQQVYVGDRVTETTDYVGSALEIVSSSGVTDYRHYIYAGGQAVAVYSRKSSGTNTFSYLLSDHQGSVASITNSSGAQVVNESYTPFGNRRNPTTWSGSDSTSDLTTSAGITREGYTFQTQLGLWMGLNHMNGRVQDSVIGRFLSPDPVVQNVVNTQSYNRYAYVTNNPLTLVDPTGFDAFDDLAQSDPFYECFGNCGNLTASSAANTMTSDGSTQTQPVLQVFSGANQNAGTYLGDIYQTSTGGWAYESANNPNYSDSFNFVVGGTALQSPSTVTQTAPSPAQSQGPFGRLASGLVNGVFGWANCVGGGCSSTQELVALAGAPMMAAMLVTGGAEVEAAEGAVTVTEKGLASVADHLSQFGDWAPNQAMIDRLTSQLGAEVTGADANFYTHELLESQYMASGMDYEAAHAAALEQAGVSPFSLYHPDVIEQLPNYFNNNWRAFWGLAPQ